MQFFCKLVKLYSNKLLQVFTDALILYAIKLAHLFSYKPKTKCNLKHIEQ